MATIIPPPKAQFFATDGSPLSGGKVYTYEAGTTTPLATYTDSSGLVQNTNPVILDSRGEASIWVNADLYKFTLKTSTDVELWTVDNLNGPSTIFAGPTGSSLIGYTNSGTGATTRTVQARLRDFTSVKDFGAVGDGNTDDTNAIQAAMDAVNARPYGGTIYFPPGQYKITSTIELRQNVNVVGAGGSEAVIYAYACNGFNFGYIQDFGDAMVQEIGIHGVNCTTQKGITQTQQASVGDQLYNVIISDVLITGFNVGIQLNTVHFVKIQNCWIQDVNSGIKLIGFCLVIDITNCGIVYAAGCGTGTQYAILCDGVTYPSAEYGRPEAVRVSNTSIYGFSYGFFIEQSIYTIFQSSDIQCTIEGITMGTVIANTIIRDNYIEVAGATGTQGIRVKPSSVDINAKITIESNYISAFNSPAGTSGIYIGTPAVGNNNNIRIVGNRISNFTAFDIVTYNSGAITIRDNLCLSTAPTYSISVDTVPAGLPVYVDGNKCAKDIGYSLSDYLVNEIRVGVNTINGTTVSYGQGQQLIDNPFAAGDYNTTNNATFNIVVTAGDVVTNAYSFNGKMMTWILAVEEASLTGVSTGERITVALPGGRTASNRRVRVPFTYIQAGVIGTGWASIDPGATYVTLKPTTTDWTSPSTDSTTFYLDITFEVTT